MSPFFLALYNGSQVSIVSLWATCFISISFLKYCKTDLLAEIFVCRFFVFYYKLLYVLYYDTGVSGSDIHFSLIRMKSLDPLRANKIFIRKAEDGPFLCFSYKSLISDPLRSDNRSQRKIL